MLQRNQNCVADSESKQQNWSKLLPQSFEMGCSTSKSAMLASMQPGDSSSSSNNNSERFVTRVLKKKFGKSRSFAPLRSNNRSRRRCDEYNYSSSYCSRMHSDYHVVALTSSTYGIMKLVEAENIMSDERKMIIDSAAATGGGGAQYGPGNSMQYCKMRKSESMPARGSCKAVSKTWIDMAMGNLCRMSTTVVRGKLQEDDVEEVESAKKPLRGSELSKSSSSHDHLGDEKQQRQLSWWETEEEEEPAETINTWELMAGLEDFTPRPPGSPLDRPGLPFADLRQKIHFQESINPPRVLKKQKQSKYSRTRSRSLSSMGAQNSEDDDHAAAAASATVVESPSLSSWASFSKFCTATTTAGEAEALDCRSVEVADDDPCSNSSLFDPDILASFASSIDGRTESTSEDQSDDQWCRDAMASTSGAGSLADESDMTSIFHIWSTSAKSNDIHSAAAEGEKQLFSKSSSATAAARNADQAWELSFANVTASAASHMVDHVAAATEELGKSQDQVSAGVEAAAAATAFDHKLCPPGHGHERLVLYTTSLRGIRKTYDDCHKLRMIFQSYLVWIDERDVSMHAEFRQELTELMGAPVQVPRVFIMGRYIGGVEQVLQLHELGLLAPSLLPLPPPPQPHLLQPASSCDGCGGLRFIPCPHCNGSCKIISKQSVSRCPHCNENGLKRCPICF